jgi:hypothetical protein
MGAPQAVRSSTPRPAPFCRPTPAIGGSDPDGSNLGITYTPDGKYLLFSQDGNSFYGSFKQGGFVAIASVRSYDGHALRLRPRQRSDGRQRRLQSDHRHLLPEQPWGTTGSFPIPCGQTVSLSQMVLTSYPTGIAVSSDAKTAYVVLDNNDTLTKIDLTAATPVEGAEVRVGNVPHSVVISPDGKTAYVSNEAGRIATETTSRDTPTAPRSSPNIRRLHGHRHRFRGRPVHVHGHRQHLDRSAPDRHGLLGQVPVGRQCL